MNNLLVAQSGGPTAAINATLSGVLHGVRASGKIDQVFGAKNGIEGVIKDHLINLNDILMDTGALDLLTCTPSSILGTCRYKLKECHQDEETYHKIITTLKKYEIKFFIYIGGNDSMDTVHKLSEYCIENNHDIKIMGAPKTIDNDLHMTDHSPGFGSAAKYIASTIKELACDIGAYDIPAVTIVEIMGRNAGWLTASAVLSRMNGGAGVDLIYLCEKEFDYKRFIHDVREKLSQKSGILIAVSEGIRDGSGAYVSDTISSGTVDIFGHKYIAGAARALEQLVRTEIGCKVRSIELSLMQRSASHLASETDIMEAMMLGQKALACALDGETGKMSVIKRISNKPYRVEFDSVPVHQVANKEKTVPIDWITPDDHDVTSDMIDYLLPLIQGEINLKYQNGIPRQFSL